MDLFLVAFADAFIEALAALVAQPAALDHLRDEGRQDEAFAPGIVGHGVIEVLGDVRPDIEADDVEQAEAGALGKTDQRAGEGVDFFDGEVPSRR